MKSVLVFLSFCLVVFCDHIRYENYSLYKIDPHTEYQVKVLIHLFDNKKIDFWLKPTKKDSAVNVLVSPENKAEFEQLMKVNHINVNTTISNVQQLIDEQILRRHKRETTKQLYFTNYQVLNDIYDFFDELANTYQNVVTVINAGESYEGRSIKGVKISRGTGRRAILLEAGQIGADWLSPTVLSYIVNELVQSDDSEISQATQDYDWYIFPVINPDGLEYTQNSERLWMKNRRPISEGIFGVDLTRNWNSHWGVVGGDFTSSSDRYSGLGPFSEIETRSFSAFVHTIAEDISVYLSFKGYGQRFVVPFGHSSEHLYNYEEAVTIARRAMGAVSAKYGTIYLVGNPSEVSEEMSGTSMDWAKHRFNFTFVGTFQLRDEGTNGYLLPVQFILPTCEEIMDGLMAIIREGKYFNLF